MQLTVETLIGITAGTCTSISMLPQLFHIVKTKKAEDISLFMLFILMAGLGFWLWYGILREDVPIIVTNAFAIIVNACMLTLSIFYKKKQ